MSADNRICIMYWDHSWFAWHGSCSVDYFEPNFDSIWFETQEQAFEWAHKEAQSMTILEGGITLVDPEEQKTALISLIKDSITRLENLNKRGTQHNDI